MATAWHHRQAVRLLGLVLAVAATPCQAQSRRTDWTALRQQMVDTEIVAAGVSDPRVIASLRKTPRHEFVPLAQRKLAYLDMALPIGASQTISPPFVVAYMTEQIHPEPTDKVLEIGTGSGYQAAVLSPLVQSVYSIEIVASLGKRAGRTLKRLGYKNVYTRVGDGYQGWEEAAPFDKIIVTCSPENPPPKLVEQLVEGGRMVIPLGERFQQNLCLLRKVKGKLEVEPLRATLFVPMTGAAEDRREVLPDPTQPAIINGSFDELAEGDTEHPRPAGWHYLRQAKHQRLSDRGGVLLFENSEPGLSSQALQGFAVDGSKVKKLRVSYAARGEDIRFGQRASQWPYVAVTFYDARRVWLGDEVIGPLRGTFDWIERSEEIPVPPRAREAGLRIGLLGAVGKLWIDDIRLSRGE